MAAKKKVAAQRKPTAKPSRKPKVVPKPKAMRRTAPKTAPQPRAAAPRAVADDVFLAPAGGALVQFLADDGTPLLGKAPALAHDTMLFLYEQMVQVREFDRRMLMLQRQGRIGFYGPILGQEAATVGSTAALEPRDWVFPALREAASAIMRGLPLEEAIAQL